jgi:hypothetical protein
LCLAAFVFAVYSPSLQFQFILDDHRFTADPRIQDSGHLWDYFTNYVWAQFTGGAPSFYRPVFLLWMRISFLVSALSPWGWHLLSIAKHVLVAALLGLLVWKLLRDSAATLLAATLFAVHPAQTESVSWVTVPDPLMSAGVLAALLFYLNYAYPAPSGTQASEKRLERKSRKSSSAKSSQRPAMWLVASTAAYFGALFAKETAIVFPAVIAALALRHNQHQTAVKGPSPTGDSDLGTRIMRGLRHTAPFVVVTVIYLLLRLNALSGKLGAVTQHLPWTTVLLSSPATLWFYVRVLVWPVRSYSFADPTLAETVSLRGVVSPLLAVTCAAAVLAAISFWAWRTARRGLAAEDAGRVETALITGVLLLILPLLLTLNLNALNPGDFLHGRYTYLPLAGLMLLVGTAWHLAGRLRIAMLCAAGVLAIVFAALTFSQQKQWKDDATVFTIAHQLAPHNAPVAEHLADVHVQAALELDQEGRCSEAMPTFEQVSRDYPQDWYAWAGLADCYVQLNNLPKAEESLHRAADLSHDSHVIEQWQLLRDHMGLPPGVPAK